jgi:hypothetical protein
MASKQRPVGRSRAVRVDEKGEEKRGGGKKRKEPEEDEEGTDTGAAAAEYKGTKAAQRMRPSSLSLGGGPNDDAIPTSDEEKEEDEEEGNEQHREGKFEQLGFSDADDSDNEGEDTAVDYESNAGSDDDDDSKEEKKSEPGRQKKEKKKVGKEEKKGKKGAAAVVTSHKHVLTKASVDEGGWDCDWCGKEIKGDCIMCSFKKGTTECHYAECRECQPLRNKMRAAGEVEEEEWSEELEDVKGIGFDGPDRGPRDHLPTSLLDIFLLFVPMVLIEKIVKNTNAYAMAADKKRKVIFSLQSHFLSLRSP